MSLEIEKNIPEQIIEEDKHEQTENYFKLESESVNSQNKDIGVTDGN